MHNSFQVHYIITFTNKLLLLLNGITSCSADPAGQGVQGAAFPWRSGDILPK